ncbi:unnamed protein product, partial [Ectocarpus fasciculatus]
ATRIHVCLCEHRPRRCLQAPGRSLQNSSRCVFFVPPVVARGMRMVVVRWQLRVLFVTISSETQGKIIFQPARECTKTEHLQLSTLKEVPVAKSCRRHVECV